MCVYKWNQCQKKEFDICCLTHLGREAMNLSFDWSNHITVDETFFELLNGRNSAKHHHSSEGILCWTYKPSTCLGECSEFIWLQEGGGWGETRHGPSNSWILLSQQSNYGDDPYHPLGCLHTTVSQPVGWVISKEKNTSEEVRGKRLFSSSHQNHVFCIMMWMSHLSSNFSCHSVLWVLILIRCDLT